MFRYTHKMTAIGGMAAALEEWLLEAGSRFLQVDQTIQYYTSGTPDDPHFTHDMTIYFIDREAYVHLFSDAKIVQPHMAQLTYLVSSQQIETLEGVIGITA